MFVTSFSCFMVVTVKKIPVYWLVVCEPDFYGYSVLKKNPILREIPLSDWMVVASSLALVY